MSKTEKEWRFGQMEQSSMGNLSKVRKKVKAYSIGPMEAHTKVILFKTIFKVWAPTRTLMVEYMKESGLITKCMEKELSLGKMAENTKVNM